MAMLHLDQLPEELLIHILDYLDTKAPSEQKIRQEPSLSLTCSDQNTLKSVSLVSRRWRRLVLPSLFRYARLRLDLPPQAQWAQCAACSQSALTFGQATAQSKSGVDSYHAEMVAAAHNAHQLSLRHGQSDEEAQQMGEAAFTERQRLHPAAVLAWVPRFYHGLKDFLVFLATNELDHHVRSFVLYTARMLHQKLDRYPHTAADRDWRYHASAAFWNHLSCVVELERIVIVAPPSDLACLTNCTIDTIADWAFGDMDYHVLELRQHGMPSEQRSAETRSNAMIPYSQLRPLPTTLPGVADSSILHLRPWTHVALNEGSFLKAYGTYEYFERGPPSIVESIKVCLNWLPIGPPQGLPGSKGTHSLCALRKFSYTAIFPFANHIEVGTLLQVVEELEAQFAPDPQSGILDDRARTGKAELEDCWQELVTAYFHLVQLVGTRAITRTTAPRLKKLICRDYAIAALQEDLDEIFTGLCLPVWAEYEPGVFTRLQMEATIPGSGSRSTFG